MMSEIECFIKHLQSNNLWTNDIDEAYKVFLEGSEEDDKMPFGKYKGRPLKDIAIFDCRYLSWVSKQSYVGEPLKKKISKYILE